MDDELYYDNGTPTTTTLPEEEMMGDDDDDTSYDSFLNQWSENEKGYVWDAIFGTLLCAAIVATGCYLSHQYRVGERAVAAEEEHRRREEIDRKVEEVESKKHELAQVIHGFAISMLSIIYNGNGNDNDNDIDNNESRATIFHGTHEDNKETCTEKTIFVGLDLDLDDRCWDEEMLEMEAAEQSPAIVTENSNNTNANLSTNSTTTNASIEAEPVMRFLEFELDDDGEDNDDESQMIDSEAVEQPAIVTENNNIMNTNTTTNTNTNITTTTTTTNSNLYVSNEGKGSEGSENDDENEECDSVPVVPLPTSLVPIPASLLLQAAENNPCAICLEDFLPSDTIIFCSNHIVVTTNNKNKKNGPQQQTTTHNNTGSYSPHCFHEACSLEYMFAHTAGVQAPCPLCRKPFLCSLYADDDGTNNNHIHENNHNHNSNSIPHRQEEEEQQQQPQQQQQQQQLATLGGDERESGSTLLFPYPPSLSVAVTHPTELMEAATSASAEVAVEAAV